MGSGLSSTLIINEIHKIQGNILNVEDITDIEIAKLELIRLNKIIQMVDLQQVENYLRSQNSSLSPRNPPRMVNDQSDCDIISVVKEKMDQRFSSLKDAFLKIDSDRSGYITKAELEETCHNWGIKLSPDDFNALDAAYPHQESKYETDSGINYNEFIAMMTQVVNYTPGEGERQGNGQWGNEELSSAIRSKFLTADLTMKEAFKQFDKDRSGYIDMEEVRLLLKSFNISFTDVQFSEFIIKFDKNGDNRFQYHEFVKILQGSV